MAESLPLPSNDGPEAGDAPPAAAGRRRPKPGERRVQILQALAAMLEQPGGERITTAALAARLQVSEAALYRHFASKAQMFEGLIEFIEQSVFALVAQIVEREVPDAPSSAEGARRAARVVAMVLQFGERNPGMVRVMVGDALVLEHERLQQRMGQFFDRIESTLRQCLRGAAEAAGSSTPTVDAQVRAAALGDLVRGRLQRYARSGLRRPPTEHLNATLALMLH
ncbi:nucleoid occlusion factor SlmA [Paracidovorax cattleyae]|uniref:nucleoid occlusion factor SlmA n=1 Tax=Paracidovorax cattleyae TaxID=80868 RepID=UPI000D175A25|nr:nucleoid occlusion factor SlmA [Paracidovorax cattleyae]AVS75646.1 nucleoid occlusion factor SlmA [Paracidovorax cattleyae]